MRDGIGAYDSVRTSDGRIALYQAGHREQVAGRVHEWPHTAFGTRRGPSDVLIERSPRSMSGADAPPTCQAFACLAGT